MSKLHETLGLEPSDTQLYNFNDAWELGESIIEHGDYVSEEQTCCDGAVVLEIITGSSRGSWDKRWTQDLDPKDTSPKFLYEHTLPFALYRIPTLHH